MRRSQMQRRVQWAQNSTLADLSWIAAEMSRAHESELQRPMQRPIAWEETGGFVGAQFGAAVAGRRITKTSDVSLLGATMKAETMHGVPLIEVRFSRQIERRSLEMHETSNSDQGVEDLYAKTQQCLAIESRLSEQKRKSVKTQDLAAGIDENSHGVLDVVRGDHSVVADAQRISLVEAQLDRQQRPLEVQDVAADVAAEDYGVPDAVHGVRVIKADKHQAEIVQQYVEMHARLSQRLEVTRRSLGSQETAAKGFAGLAQAGPDGIDDSAAGKTRAEIVQRYVEMQSHLPQRPVERRRTLQMRSVAESGAARLAQADVETAEMERRCALQAAMECAEELQQMAHQGRGWPQLRQEARAPTEGEPIVGKDEYNFDVATVAPLLIWLTPHFAAWAMGRMATAVVRAARTKLSWSAHRGRGQTKLSWSAHRGRGQDAVNPQLVELAHRGQPTVAPEARPEYPLKIWGGIDDLMLWCQRRQRQKCPEYPLKAWGGIDDLMLRHRERTAGQQGCPDDRSMRQAAARTLRQAAQWR